MGLLAGQVCIVTGAGQGLGRAVALEMVAEGAKVMLLERNPATLRTVEDEVAAAGGIARPFQLDVTDYETYRAAVGSIIDEFGRVDVLVNNAAINPPARTILQDTLEDWRRTIAINLESVYMGSKLVAPHMVPQVAATRPQQRSLRKDAGQCSCNLPYKPISSAVMRPMRHCASESGITASDGVSGMRPPMISARVCGNSGCRSGSAYPSGYAGSPVDMTYLSVAPSTCISSCAITTWLRERCELPA